MRNEGPLTVLRRDVLNLFCVGLSLIAGAILAIPFVGFFVAPLLRQVPRRWRVLGPADSFPVGSMTLVSYVDSSPLPWAGVTGKSAAYVHRTSDTTWQAFSIHCTHLGCPVRWVPTAELFMCPCHGGVYYPDGTVAAGPPPQHLIHMALRVRAGNLEILTRQMPIT